MDILGILDPDPHENLCGSETLKWVNLVLSGIRFHVMKGLMVPVAA